MKIFDNIMDYYNYYYGNGYKVVLSVDKIYYHREFMKSEIIKWLEEHCGSQWNIKYIEDNDTGDTMISMIFPHKDQALLFKLWLE